MKLDINYANNLYPLEVVHQCSETQFQLDGNVNSTLGLYISTCFLQIQKDDQPKNQKIGETSDLGKNSDHKKKIKKQKVKIEATAKRYLFPSLFVDIAKKT